MNPGLNPAAESAYQKRVEREAYEACRMAALLALLLFPAFSVLDWFTHRAEFFALSLIRFSTTLVYLGLYILTRKRVSFGNAYLTGLIILGLASASITSLCLVLDGYRSPYYAGVNLVVLAAGLLFPWNARRMAGYVGVIVGIYVAMVLINAKFSIERPDLLVNNLYFLFGTSVISVASAHLSDRLRRESFSRFLEVEQAQAKLRRYDRIKTQFFANVSHELRTPLALILGPTRSLLTANRVSNPQDRVELEVIERNARMLLKQVNDLLDVAKLEAGQAAMSYAEADLAELVRRVASHFELLVRDREIDFTVNAPTTLPAQVDPQKLERVLMNLLSNAFKFTPPKGRVRCELSSGARGLATIRVADSGPGIPAALREAVFERFFQAQESSTRDFGGTGLGLAIVKDFVQMHHGTISIEKAPEGGAELRIELPLHAPAGTVLHEWKKEVQSAIETDADLEALPSVELSLSSRAQASAPRVLVVEDNTDMRLYIARVLEGRFAVELAADARQGFDRAVAHPPDLILSDVMMPGMSGADLLARIRETSALDHVPMVLLTAKADDELRERLLRQGAQDYVLKPFSPDELRARIENLVAIKRSRDLLQAELGSRESDIERLAGDMALRKRHLQRAIQFIRAARNQAQKALEARDEFISIASHELKTPLTSMKLQSSLFLRKLAIGDGESLGPEAAKTLALRTEEQVDRLTRLVEDMLDLSRINSGQLKLVRSTVDLGRLVEEVAARLRVQFDQAGVSLRVKIEAGIRGEWDRHRIDQITTNLLTNALKYGGAKPVDVRVFTREGRAVLEVEDRGIGIAHHSQERIFQRFERAAGSEGIGGLGLGLYVTRQLTEAHGGNISVKSDVGRGSVFTVELPTHPAIRSRVV